MTNPIEDLKQYLLISNQERLEPQACYKRHPSVIPSSCIRYTKAISNGEPEGACCSQCPIADYRFCPDVEKDRLSLLAIEFTSWYDHPANEGYRNIFLDTLFPVLSPQELLPWLLRRQAVWDTYKNIIRELDKKAVEEAKTNSQPRGN